MEIVVVDSGLAGWQGLAAEFAARGEVLVLDAGCDGVRRLAGLLADRRGISALHLVSHGEPGLIRLGTAVLSLATLSAYRDSLDCITAALAPNADLLVYGCRTGLGAAGADFLAALAALTGARVAASQTLTGAAALGGDWELAARVGLVRTAALSSPDFAGVLTTYTAGTESQVNTYTTGTQANPVVTALSGGGYVVTWGSGGQDGAGYGVYGQVYDASGATVGSEFSINTYTADDQLGQTVTGLSDGGFVVTWCSSGQDGDSYGVYGQIYDAGGNASGGEFQVNTYTTSGQEGQTVTALSGGGFVVTWKSSGQDGDLSGVYGQRYDASGATVGGEFQVNTYTTNYQDSQTVTALSGGGFLVTWRSTDQDGSSDGVYGQIYDANGNVSGSEFQVNTYTTNNQSDPAVTALSGGGFVVTWTSDSQDESGSGVYGQLYDASGNASGSEFRVNTYTTNNQISQTVTALSGGGFVVTWTSEGQDGDASGVYGQLYDASGNASGGEFLVNTYTTGNESSQKVVALSDGGFVVTWTMEPTQIFNPNFFGAIPGPAEDGSGSGVFGQVFDASGAAVGGEFQVNTYTTGDQANPVVTALSGGGFVVAWNSNGQDGDGAGVYQKIYTVAGANGGDANVDGAPTCYLRGTHIRTPSGEVPVEILRPGDRVCTALGEDKPVTWVGRRRLLAASLTSDKLRALHRPILIRAAAFVDGVPHRDLFVSSRHGVAVNGCLIEARDLINGHSIVQVDTHEVIEYFHVELDNHEIIYAEGLTAESYVEADGNRAGFDHGWGGDGKTAPAGRNPLRLYVRPVTEGPDMESVKDILTCRALRQGQERGWLRPAE